MKKRLMARLKGKLQHCSPEETSHRERQWDDILRHRERKAEKSPLCLYIQCYILYIQSFDIICISGICIGAITYWITRQSCQIQKTENISHYIIYYLCVCRSVNNCSYLDMNRGSTHNRIWIFIVIINDWPTHAVKQYFFFILCMIFYWSLALCVTWQHIGNCGARNCLQSVTKAK